MTGRIERPDRSREGAALPLAIFALAVVGSLIAAMFWMSVYEHRAGRAALGILQAFTEAERALAQRLQTVSAGPAEFASRMHPAPDGRRIGAITNLHSQRGGFVLLTATGWSTDGVAHQRLNLVLRRRPVPYLGVGPIRTLGSSQLASTIRIDASPGEPPDEASCAPPSGPAAPTSLRDLSRWLRTRATFNIAGGAVVTPRPTVDPHGCVETSITNWGDPLGHASQCARWMPIIHASGDLVVRGGVGRGAVVVDGDLTVVGSFVFSGVLVVNGRFTTSGVGFGITGAVIAAAADLRGRGTLAASSCATGSVLKEAAGLEPLVGPSWFMGSQ